MACKRNLLFQQILTVSAGVLLLTMVMMVSTAQGGRMTGQSRILLQTVCSQICYDVSYTTCTSSGDEHLQAYCNCCILNNALPNAGSCTLHLTDGSEMSCS